MRKAAFAEGRSDVDTAPRDKNARHAHERKRGQKDGQPGATGRPYGTGLACGIQRTNESGDRRRTTRRDGATHGTGLARGIQRTNVSGDRKTDNPRDGATHRAGHPANRLRTTCTKKIPGQGSNGRAYQAHSGRAALSAATRPPSVQGREPERDEGKFCRGMRLQEIYRQDVFHAHDASVLHAGRPFGSA